MPEKIQGLDLVLEIDENDTGDWKFLVCETSSGLAATRNTTSTATKCEGGTAAVGLGSKEYNISYSGVVAKDPDIMSQMSYTDILRIFDNGTRVRFRRVDKDNVVSMDGFGYITDLNETADTENAVTFDFTLLVDGGVNFGNQSSS